MYASVSAEEALAALSRGENFVCVPDSHTLEHVVESATGSWKIWYGGSGATYAQSETGLAVRNLRRVTESAGGFRSEREFAEIAFLWGEFLRVVGCNERSGISGIVSKICPSAREYRQDRREGEAWRKKLCLAGRAEVLSLGETEPLEVFDINSAYPWSYGQKLPGRLLSTCLGDIPDSGECAGDVVLQVPEGILPPCPYGGEEGYFWPSGEFRVWLCGPELKLARDLGCVQKIHRVWHWESVDILSQFSQALFDLRIEAKLQGQKEIAGFIKLCLNAVFGLFASKTRSKIAVVRPRVAPKGGIPRGKGVWMTESKTHPTLYHPLAAAFITSRVRERLYRTATLCERATYLGIDSIHCLSSDARKPSVGVGLGSWKSEGVWEGGGAYLGTGRYLLDGECPRTRHQGDPNSRKVILDAKRRRIDAIQGDWIGIRIAHGDKTRAPTVSECDALLEKARNKPVLRDYRHLTGE